jgi:hypothetical protein
VKYNPLPESIGKGPASNGPAHLPQPLRLTELSDPIVALLFRRKQLFTAYSTIAAA